MRPHERAVLVEAPASAANLGPGFDVLAVALKKPADRVQIERDDALTGFTFRVPGDPTVPTGLSNNAASAVVGAMIREFGIKSRVRVRLHKGVPVGVGLGSSAASSVAAAVATDACFDLHLSQARLLEFAALGEEISSGARHYDNVAASLAGGFVIVGGFDGHEALRIPSFPSIKLCLVTPAVKLPSRKTEYARSLLPDRVSLDDLTSNVARASTMILGLVSGDIALVGRSMRDSVVEPARSKMIPRYETVRDAALEAGAAGVCISGAGPTVLALYDAKRASGRGIILAMVSTFSKAKVQANGFTTSPGEGARVVSQN